MDQVPKHNGARSFGPITLSAVALTMLVGTVVATTGASAQTLAADTRGRLVLATVGSAARYLPNGALDSDFGVNGIAGTTVGDYSRPPAVDVSANGAVILAACAFSETTGVVFEIAKLTAAGAPDPSFQSVQVTQDDPHPDCLTQVKFVSGGRILVAGYWLAPDRTCDFTVARYNGDGSPDATFGVGGRFVSDLPLGPIAINPKGEILALAIEEPAYSDTVRLARFTRDGQLDSSFGNGGIVSVNLPVGGYFEHIALTPDGQIVLGGSIAFAQEEPYAAIVRLTRSGRLDSTFGQGGVAWTRIGTGDFIWLNAIGVEPNGTVYAAGATFGPAFVAHETRVVLMRFNRSGRQDTSLGTNGFYLRSTPVMHATLALLNGGKVVLGWYDAAWHYVLTRVPLK